MSELKITRDTWDFSSVPDELLGRVFLTEFAVEALKAYRKASPIVAEGLEMTPVVRSFLRDGPTGLYWYDDLVKVRQTPQSVERKDMTVILRMIGQGSRGDSQLPFLKLKEVTKSGDLNWDVIFEGPSYSEFLEGLSAFDKKEMIQCSRLLGNIIPLLLPWEFPKIPSNWYEIAGLNKRSELLQQLAELGEGHPFLNRENKQEVLDGVVERDDKKLQLKFYLPYQFSKTNFFRDFEQFIHSDACDGRFRQRSNNHLTQDLSPNEFFNLREAPDYSIGAERSDGAVSRKLAGAFYMDVDTRTSKNIIKEKFRHLIDELDLPKGRRELRPAQCFDFFRSRLKALGVYRLAKSRSLGEVESFCAERGRRLYENNSQYSHAKMQAIFIMRSLFVPALPTVHFST